MSAGSQGFAVPKAGNREADYEDAFAIAEHRVAIADGATESSFARAWAEALVSGFASDPAAVGDVCGIGAERAAGGEWKLGEILGALRVQRIPAGTALELSRTAPTRLADRHIGGRQRTHDLEQQPAGQLCAVHLHTPATHAWPATHAAPPPHLHVPLAQVSAAAPQLRHAAECPATSGSRSRSRSSSPIALDWR